MKERKQKDEFGETLTESSVNQSIKTIDVSNRVWSRFNNINGKLHLAKGNLKNNFIKNGVSVGFCHH